MFELLAGPAFFIALLIIGAALIALAFGMSPRTPAPVPVPAAPVPTPSKVLSQVGFAEVDGRVVAFRSVVRQGEDLTDQQLAAFQSHLLAPAPRSSYAA